jgi:hypothetical protein
MVTNWLLLPEKDTTMMNINMIWQQKYKLASTPYTNNSILYSDSRFQTQNQDFAVWGGASSTGIAGFAHS